jgi:hypothetical protein
MRLEHHDVRDSIGPRTWAAVRAYRAALRHRAEEQKEMEMIEACDHQFDAGEWSDGAWSHVWEAYFMGIATRVGQRFGLTGEQVQYAAHMAEEIETDCWQDSHRVCPYHERGLDCRNSAPAGIDADGEPYGDQGCGCYRKEPRLIPPTPLLEVRTVRHACTNSTPWELPSC